MKNEEKKKGILGSLLWSKKEKKGGCCNFEIEEIKEIEKEKNELIKESNNVNTNIPMKDDFK